MQQIQISSPVISSPGSAEHVWDAINVIMGNPDMSFHGATVYNQTTGTDHHSRDGFPVDIAWGDIVAVSYSTKNTGDVTLKVRLYIEFLDPAGSVLWSGWEPSSGYFTVNPGVFMASKKTAYFTLNMEGVWQIYGLIDFELA